MGYMRLGPSVVQKAKVRYNWSFDLIEMQKEDRVGDLIYLKW